MHCSCSCVIRIAVIWCCSKSQRRPAFLDLAASYQVPLNPPKRALFRFVKRRAFILLCAFTYTQSASSAALLC